MLTSLNRYKLTTRPEGSQYKLAFHSPLRWLMINDDNHGLINAGYEDDDDLIHHHHHHQHLLLHKHKSQTYPPISSFIPI